MISLPLSIRYADEPRRPAVGWLICGAGAADWLAEWARWELPMSEWRIVPIDGVGVLTILPDGQAPRHSPLAMPIGRVSGRIYVPTHADLSCAAEPSELESLLLEEVALAVLLPEQGALAVTAEHILSVGDLLAAPLARESDWSRALPGEALNDRLQAVFPEMLPSLDDFLQEGRGDIGSQSPDVKNLPPRPGEPRNGFWDKAKRGMKQAAAEIAGYIAGMIPADSSPPPRRSGKSAGHGAGNSGSGALGGWLTSLANWASQATNGLSQQLMELRNKEVLRLLHMLESNPDEGLKYALPFGGDAHRGQAPPGAGLVPRNVDFNLRNLGGGGPADLWDLPLRYQEELRRRYLVLANRELSLRRYRRAAYIFAELLNELDAAAAALQSGGHYREAATLYSERLHRPLSAAQCLEQGGLLTEAIPIYQRLGHDEKVGDLYARLEQPEEAEAAWRQAIESAIGHDDFLDAARIAERKLNRDDEALTILNRGWSQSNQAAACLTRTFELLGQRGRHDEAHKRLREFRSAGLDGRHDLMIAETLAAQVGVYPDVEFCSRAADIVRVLAGAHLRGALEGDRQRFVLAVQQLAPGDKLLERDGRRYLAGHIPPRAQRPLPRGLPQPRRIRQFQLPPGIDWKAAVAQGVLFYAAGIANGKLELIRGGWTGEVQSAHALGHFGRLPESADICLAADVQGRGPLLVASSHGKLEGSWRFAASVSLPNSAHAIAVEDSNGNMTAGLCYAHALVCQLVGLYPCAARCYGIDNPHNLGALTRTLEIGHIPEEVETFLPTYGRPDLLAVGLGRELRIFTEGSAAEIFELPEVILHLAGSAPFSRLKIAAGLAHGGSFMWAAAGHRIEDLPRRFAEDLIAPSVCFTATGMLVAVSENGGEVYGTADGKLVLKGRMPPLGQRPLAVFPTDFGHQFAMLQASGAVEVMELEI